jgi:NAD(P)H-hydrate epimerase
MVFFASPDPGVGEIASKIKATLGSFIWVPWEETDEYIKKSDAVLIGPGLMRFHSEKSEPEKRVSECDEVCRKTKEITRNFLSRFPEKKWVIDGGSLQVMESEWIPQRAILTPNEKEYEMLFGEQFFPQGGISLSETIDNLQLAAGKYKCVIVHKGPTAYVTDGETTYEIPGGNAGLTKGGTGDTLAGMTVGLLAKNEPLLAAAAASLAVKKTAEELYKEVGYNYNSDDIAQRVFRTLEDMKRCQSV